MFVPKRKLLSKVSLLSSAIYALVPMDWTTYSDSHNFTGRHIDTITVLHPEIKNFFFYFAFISFIILFLIGLTNKRKGIYADNAFIIALLFFPVSCLISFYFNLAPWITYGEIKDGGENKYYFMDSSFLQGQTMALTRQISENLVMRKMKVLGTNNGDSPRSYASIIRPSDIYKEEYGQLYLSNDTFLVGVRYANKCYLLYNLKTNKFIGHGDIEEISPFICIGMKTSLYKPDVNAILEVIKIGEIGQAGFPNENAVKADMNHPNTEVQKVAKQILLALKNKENH